MQHCFFLSLSTFYLWHEFSNQSSNNKIIDDSLLLIPCLFYCVQNDFLLKQTKAFEDTSFIWNSPEGCFIRRDKGHEQNFIELQWLKWRKSFKSNFTLDFSSPKAIRWNNEVECLYGNFLSTCHQKLWPLKPCGNCIKPTSEGWA